MAKPDFDPNQPFQKVQDSKPAFDETKPFQSGNSSENGSGIMSALHGIGRAADYAFGAAPRASIGAIENGDNPISAFIQQYGKPPETAPTGKQLAAGVGIPDKEYNLGEALKFDPNNPHFYEIGGQTDPEKTGGYQDVKVNPAAAAGVPIEMGANLLNVVPGLGALAEGEGTAAKTAEMVSELPGYAATKAASTVTGLPKKAIEVYAKRGPEVNAILDSTGGELPVAADQMKQKVLDSIAATKKGLNGAITQDLANNPSVVPAQPIIDKLQAAKAKLNPHYNPSDIAQIDDMINGIQSTAQNGTLNMQDLFDTKKFLQTRGQNAYVNNGQLFSTGAEAQKAAKQAGGVARDLLHSSSPEIAHSDSVFEHLHDLDDKMSASLLGQGKPENVFASAGGGTGNIHQVNLRKVGELTGTNPVSDAELLYAAKNMKDPDTRATLLKMALDAKRNTYDAIPTGTSTSIDNLLQLIGGNSSPLYPAYAGGNDAMSRRISSKKQ